MKLVEYTRGSAIRILFMDCDQKKFDVEDFLAEIETSRPNDHAQLIALLDKTATYGVVQNPHKIKPLRCDHAKPIWEFCAQQCSRIFWFFDEEDNAVIVCTHGFVAKKNHDHKNDIKRAQDRRDLYYSERDRLKQHGDAGNKKLGFGKKTGEN